jgi:hypothetical protein
MRLHASTAAAVFLLLAPIAPAQVNNAPCFESNLGTNLGLGDEAVAASIGLGFTFPGPAGPVAAIDIASNGFVWLGSNPNPRCCDGQGFQFVADPPSIAAMWENLDPSRATSGGVFFNAIPASGGAPARAVITWLRTPESPTGPPVTVQMQLLSTGGFVIWHDPGNAIAARQALVGVTQGNGATPNPIAFSSIGGIPLDTGSNPTAYQDFASSNYDIGGRSYDFEPNGQGGYRIFDRLGCRSAAFTTYGTGCPAATPVSFYEQFAAGTFDLNGTGVRGTPNGQNGYVLQAIGGTLLGTATNNLGLTDDSVSGPIWLPFDFPHPAGPTRVISVSSNGFVWFMAGGTDRAFADFTILLQDPPSLAGLWMDLNPDLAVLGGGVFADPDPNGQAFYVTWSGVPEYNNPGANTFQIALFANGNFELRWPSASVGTHQAVVGYSTGNFAPDPGPIDLSSALPFNTGPGAEPLRLAAASGSSPRIGTTFTLQTSAIPAGTALGFMLFAFNSAAIDLTGFGMAGYTGYVDFLGSPTSVTAFTVPGPTAPFPVAVPNSSLLIGLALFAQAATLSGGFNSLGAIASNGGRIDVGR